MPGDYGFASSRFGLHGLCRPMRRYRIFHDIAARQTRTAPRTSDAEGVRVMAKRRPEGSGASPLDENRAGAWDALYRQYAPWLGRMLSRRLRASALEVDDLVQETYLRASRYDANEARRHPKALLLRIAVNLARDDMRRNVVRGGLDATYDEEAITRLASAPDQHQAALLKQVILGLPPLYRDVFVLNRFTGLTYEEIASHVGISVKTVEWRMSRALQLCTERLKD